MKLSEVFKTIKPAKCTRAAAKGITEVDIVNPLYSVMTELFLQDNKISSMNNISQFSNLTRLVLENNAILDVEELKDIRNLPKLREIRLKGNPICNIPLFHQQIANFFEDFIIIDSKKVHFTENKAKYENNIIFSIYISDFFSKNFSKILKKPKFEYLINQLNTFLKTNDYINFAHTIRYSFLKCDVKTYFIHLRKLCTQKIHNDCGKCSSFESLSNLIAKIYYSKLSYLSEDDIKQFNFPFFNNLSIESKDESTLFQTTNTFLSSTNVNNFYSSCYFNKKTRKVIPQIRAVTKSEIKKIETDEDSTIAFDIEIETTKEKNSTFHQENLNEINNNNNNNLSQIVKNQNSESSVRKNCLSMPVNESDFSTFSIQQAVIFSEPLKTNENKDKKLTKQLSIEGSAEFSFVHAHEHQSQENEHIELLNTSSSSSNSKSRKSSMKLALSTSSSSSMTPSTNKQKNSNSPKDKNKVVNSNNLEEVKNEENNEQANTNDENSQKKEISKSEVTSSFADNDSNMISEANAPKSENSFDNEDETTLNENSQTKVRKRVRREKKTLPDDSISEVFEE